MMMMMMVMLLLLLLLMMMMTMMIMMIIVMLVLMVMVIMMMMMMKMVTLKGVIQDFLPSPHCAANCLEPVRSSGQGAIICKSYVTYRALTTCNMVCATW